MFDLGFLEPDSTKKRKSSIESKDFNNGIRGGGIGGVYGVFWNHWGVMLGLFGGVSMNLK